MDQKGETEMVEKHILTLAGVEILARVENDDEVELAKLETVAAMIQNAFVPRQIKEELELEKEIK